MYVTNTKLLKLFFSCLEEAIGFSVISQIRKNHCIKKESFSSAYKNSAFYVQLFSLRYNFAINVFM